MEVQRSGTEGTEGLQIGGRARVYEDPSCCAGRQVGTAVCLGHAAVGSGCDVEIRSVGIHGEHASATCIQARRARATHRDASSAIGRSSRSAGQARFAEKRMEQGDGDEWACRVRVPVPRLRRRLSDTPEIQVSSWESSRGAEAGISVRARRRVPTASSTSSAGHAPRRTWKVVREAAGFP